MTKMGTNDLGTKRLLLGTNLPKDRYEMTTGRDEMTWVRNDRHPQYEALWIAGGTGPVYCRNDMARAAGYYISMVSINWVVWNIVYILRSTL